MQGKSSESRILNKDKKILGWREWLSLPELGVDLIKAKIDTGARTSSLHAFDLKIIHRAGLEYVRFKVHPFQRNTKVTVTAECPVLEYRNIRSSTGHASRRPVIVTTLRLDDQSWPIELTLANRDQMGFRMLLGREGIRRRVLIDAGRSYMSSLKNDKASASTLR